MKIISYSDNIYFADNGKQYLACDGLLYAVEYIGNGKNAPKKLTGAEIEAIRDFAKENEPQFYTSCKEYHGFA